MAYSKYELLLKQIKRAKMTHADRANLIYFILSLKMKPNRYVSYLLACIHLEWEHFIDNHGKITLSKKD